MNIKNNHCFRLKSLLDKYTQYCLLILGTAAYGCSCQAATATTSASLLGPQYIALNSAENSIIIGDKDPSASRYRFVRCTLSPTKDINECSVVHTSPSGHQAMILTPSDYEVFTAKNISSRKYVYEICDSERRCSTVEKPADTQPDYSIAVGSDKILTFTGNSFIRLEIVSAPSGGKPTATISSSFNITGINSASFGTIKFAAYNPTNNQIRLFATKDSRNTLYNCTLNTSKTSITCNQTIQTFIDINSMAYSPSGDFLFYTTNSGLKRCPADFTTITQCVEAIPNAGDRSAMADPFAITFNRSGNEAYISSVNTKKIFHCSVSGSGNLNACYEAKQTIETTFIAPNSTLTLNTQNENLHPNDRAYFLFKNISGRDLRVLTTFIGDGNNVYGNWLTSLPGGSRDVSCPSTTSTLASNHRCGFGIQVPLDAQNGEFVISLVASGPEPSNIKRLNFFRIHVSGGHISISHGNSPGEDVGEMLHLVNGQSGQLLVVLDHPSPAIYATISNSLLSVFSGNCSFGSGSDLARTGRCTLNFNLNDSTVPVNGNLNLRTRRATLLSLPVSISNLNVGFTENSDTGSSGTTHVVDLSVGDQGTLTIRNNGEALHNFQLRVPGEQASWFTSSDCPLTSAVNFAGGQTCTLSYNIPSNAPTATVSITPVVDSSVINSGILSLHISPLHLNLMHSDGIALRSLNLVRQQAGQLRLFASHTVSGLALHFTDSSGNASSQLTRFFSGSCLTQRSLQANSSCTLNYNIDVGDEFISLSGLLNVDVDGVHNAFVLPVHISSNFDLGFSSDRTQKFANILAGNSGNLTIYNNGHDISQLRFVLPTGNEGFYLNNVDCPVGTGRVFRRGDHCTLQYSTWSFLRNSEFRVIPVVGSMRLEAQALRVNVSELDASEEFHSNGDHHGLQAIDHLSLYKNMNGHITLNTKHQIEDMSVSFSNPALADHFYGNCMNISSLAADGTCSLNYTVDSDATIDRVINGRMLVHRGHGENQQTIFSLPVTLHPETAVSVTTESFHRYNRGSITFHNNTDRTLYRFKVRYNSPFFKLVGQNCSASMAPNSDCIIKLIPLGGKINNSLAMSVSSESTLPQDVQIPVGDVPVHRLKIEDRGGYVLRAYYPKLDSDGNISVGSTGDFSSPQNKTVDVAYFNDLNDLPSYILPNDDEKRIRLKPVGFIKNRYLSLPSCGSAIARCTRSTSNPNCYYRQGC